jgi:hypothetical protein
VSAGDGTAADVQRRANELVDAERFGSDGCADNVDNGVGGPDLMKMNVLEVDIVNLGFGCTEGKKNLSGDLFDAVTERRGSDDAKDLAEMAAVRVTVIVRRITMRMFRALVRMIVRMRVFGRGLMGMTMLMLVRVGVAVSIRLNWFARLATSHWPLTTLLVTPNPWPLIPAFLLLPKFLARHVFLAVHDDVELGSRDASAIDARDLQRGPDVEVGDGLLQDRKRNSGVEQGAKKHVATDSGEAVEIGYTHGKAAGSCVKNARAGEISS